MKTRLTPRFRPAPGYVLIIVLIMCGISIIVLAASMNRISTVAKLNDRNREYVITQNAAEAAVEKAYAMMAYDFQAFGPGAVTNNLDNYRKYIPTNSENAYWGQFQFNDAQGNVGRTYVSFLTNYAGPLPSQYPGIYTENAPVYRIVSNAKLVNGVANYTAAMQEDVLCALVPITTYAIFYNGLMEFSVCATFTINGRVHANGPIYVGAGGGSTLTFNDAVTTTGNLSAPDNDGASWGSNWRTTFNDDPDYSTNVASVNIAMNMTNSHALIDIPPSGESPTSPLGRERLYNKAHVILTITNTSITVQVHASINGEVPGNDTGITWAVTNLNLIATNGTAMTTNGTIVATNFPFLSLTNTFTDQRENKQVFATQIDIKKYGLWIATNASIVSKFPSGSGTYPTILYVADNRKLSSSQLAAVRVTNSATLPSNGGFGFTIATPNPLYTYGHYNVGTNTSFLGTTNTSATVPAALMSDSLTILSSAWRDSESADDFDDRDAVDTTVNAAIMTGSMPSTGTTDTTFGGGAMNLTRLLEDWLQGGGGNRKTLTLNTSIVRLYDSTKATNQFRNPGNFGLPNPYYDPPTREFNFDLNFLNPNKQPPGVPCALVPIRFGWAIPPTGSVTYTSP